MARKKSFLLVNLQEQEARKLAKVIGNETCRKLLDYMASQEKGVTETQAAESLSLPLSTVHYNIQHLLASKLVVADEYHYSKKGREVLHYSLANQYVIIAPKSASTSVLNKIKTLLPVLVLVSAASATIQFLAKPIATSTSFGVPTIERVLSQKAAPVMAEATVAATPGIVADAMPMAMEVAEEMAVDQTVEVALDTSRAVGDMAMEEVGGEIVTETIIKTVEVTKTVEMGGLPIGLWFLLGGLLTMGLWLIIEKIRKN